ncbi:MAG: hypothetical protein NC131_08725 [Roseburia sp.]|nr:hypothetical protein [Roseburia sp.]
MAALLVALTLPGCSASGTSVKNTGHMEKISGVTEDTGTNVSTVSELKLMLNATLTEGQTTYALGAEGIPEASASLELSLRDLDILPDESGYTAKEGRAGVELKRTGDKVRITGRCDSINRLLAFYRDMSFGQYRTIDSLACENSLLRETNARQATELATAYREAVESRDKPPETRHWWAITGFVAGLLLHDSLNKAKTKVTSFIRNKIWHT